MREESRLNVGPWSRSLLGVDRVSWGAIFAGVILALVIQLMLGLLGVGIGAATVDPRTEQSPLSGLGAGSAIWLVISTIIAMFIGGWTAGRLSGVVSQLSGVLHGAVVWGLATLVALYFLTSTAGGLISGAANLLGGVVSTGSQVAAQSPGLSDEIREQLRQRGIDIDSLEARAQDERTQAQAAEKARQAGSTIAGGISRAGIFGFFAMLIGLASALWGAAIGVPREPTATVPTERAA